MLGFSEETHLTKYIPVSEDVEKKVASIAQDLIHVAIALGVTVRQITGSQFLKRQLLEIDKVKSWKLLYFVFSMM